MRSCQVLASFSRAIRRGNRVPVSGSTATHRGGVVGGSSAAAQSYFALDKIEAALIALGSSLSDVIGTRIYVRHIADWQAVAVAHGERFKGICPANTLVQAGLVGDEYLVEIEAEAELG